MLEISSFRFYIPEKVIILSSFFKDSFPGNRRCYFTAFSFALFLWKHLLTGAISVPGRYPGIQSTCLLDQAAWVTPPLVRRNLSARRLLHAQANLQELESPLTSISSLSHPTLPVQKPWCKGGPLHSRLRQIPRHSEHLFTWFSSPSHSPFLDINLGAVGLSLLSAQADLSVSGALVHLDQQPETHHHFWT